MMETKRSLSQVEEEIAQIQEELKDVNGELKSIGIDGHNFSEEYNPVR